MKQFFLGAAAFFVLGALQAQVKFEALQFSPQFPKAGQTIHFSYNAELSPLIDEKNVDVAVFLFTSQGMRLVEPRITKSGKKYSGSFKIDTTVYCIAMGLSSDNVKDANSANGYIIPVYTAAENPDKRYFLSASSLQSGLGEYLFEMDDSPAKALITLEEGLKIYPAAKYENAYFSTFLRLVSLVKKNEAKTLIEQELRNFENRGNFSEEDYSLLIQWYGKIKQKEKSDSLDIAMKAAFTNGNWKKSEAITKINREKELNKKLELFREFTANYPATKDNLPYINNFRSQIANAYSNTKDYALFYKWHNDGDKRLRASSFNTFAWILAKNGEDLQEAKKMSWLATAYAKEEITKPTAENQESLTSKQWVRNRKGTFAMYADTYAFILYKLGEYKEGYTYAKEAAEINGLKNADYNERYAMLIEKVLPAADAQKTIERFVKSGVASSKTKELLKQLYLKQNKPETGYDAYITSLEMAAKIKRREELAKTMLNEAAPKFSLKDMEGNTVSLEGLKCKVVIVDFWATWCGPCIASMPAMKKAMDRFKTREDVAFVFVDAWETAENKLQNATDFMKKNNYPFHVLMDDDNTVATGFKVNSIPTKFVIDKTGNIRFKKRWLWR